LAHLKKKKIKKNLKLCRLTQVFTPTLGYVTMKNYKAILAHGLKRTTHWAKPIYDKVRGAIGNMQGNTLRTLGTGQNSIGNNPKKILKFWGVIKFGDFHHLGEKNE
jgi:hypothetical protein